MLHGRSGALQGGRESPLIRTFVHIPGAAWRAEVAAGSMSRVSQPSPLAGARQHAQTLAGSGDLGGARAVLEHAVGAGRANLGEDDLEVLATAQELGRLLLAADDPSGARRVLEEAYAAGQWRHGDSAPVMLLISHDIGVAAEELGNRHEARKAFTRVAMDGPAVLGDHPAVARARAYLGEDPPTVRMELPSPPPVPPPVQEPAYRDAPPTAPIETFRSVDDLYPAHFDPAPEVAPRRFGPAPNLQAGPDAYQRMPSTPYDPPPLEAGQGAPTEPVRDYMSAPAHPVQHIVSAPTAHEQQQSAYARRAPALFAAIAAVLAAVIAVVALVVVLAQRDNGSGGGEDYTPTLAGDPPTDVRLRDRGSSISVDWADPASGTVPFIVSGAPQGAVFKPFRQVNPGETTYTVEGLNPGLNYCFAVVAVYSTTQFATSPQVCTSRKLKSPG